MRTPVIDAFRPALHAACRLYFGLRLVGTEHIPAEGPLIVTPNHQTFADPPLVSIPVRTRVYYMAWDRLFDIRGLSWLIRRLRAFPVDIEGRDPRATREAMRILATGAALMIFPEAERSVDGRVGRFKPGAYRLAASTGAPVLPVTIAGGWECWPPGRLLPRPGRITITYHPPLRPDPALPPRDAARGLAEQARAVIESALPAPPSTPRGDQARRSSTR